MLEINVSQWGDWDEMIDYIKEMQSLGLKITLTNISELFTIWHGEELEQMGFSKRELSI